MTQYDQLWNYNNPAETEVKFREALEKTSPEKDLSEHLQLLTQLARTQSLQRKFPEAHEILDGVGRQLTEEQHIEHIRYFLERGRTFNSSGDKRNAEICFRTSLVIAKNLNQDFYVIDALHMLAIISTPQIAVGINEEALLFAENSKEERAKEWLGSLYNNLGWSYFDKGEYEKALSIFLRALKWREDKKQEKAIFIAKWCVARTLRAVERFEDALKVQLALFEESVNTGQNDGYVHEELGELFLLKNDKQKSAFHFQKAYEMLSADPYLAQNEKARLDRMKELSK